MTNIWLFPGTFDPITLGHETTIRRISNLCDELHICVIENYNKTPLFSLSERISFIQSVCDDLSNIKVLYVPQFTCKYARTIGAKIIIRGLRSAHEYEQETNLANYYRNQYPDIETLFLPSEEISGFYPSSTLLKDICLHNGNLSNLINPKIAETVKQRIMEGK